MTSRNTIPKTTCRSSHQAPSSIIDTKEPFRMHIADPKWFFIFILSYLSSRSDWIPPSFSILSRNFWFLSTRGKRLSV